MRMQLMNLRPVKSLGLLCVLAAALMQVAGCGSKPVASVPTTAPVTSPDEQLRTLSEKCGGDFNKLSSEEQTAANQLSGNRGEQAIRALASKGR